MKKLLIFIILLTATCFVATGQNLQFRIGFGLDLDMGIRINSEIPPNTSLSYENVAQTSMDVFTKFSFKGFNITPDFKFSLASFGKGKRTAVNESGTTVPEGEYLSIAHDGDFYETIEREPYLLNKTYIAVNTISAGVFVTKDFWYSYTGNFEAGTGFFYFKRQVNFKEYMATDTYEYLGSTGSHTTHYQTDEFVFSETKRGKRSSFNQRMNSYLFSVPVILQYNFRVGSNRTYSPAFIVYLGKDTYYTINFSVAFGNNYNTKSDE